MVMQHLRLGEGDFAWLFIPTIGGMTLGAFLSGRMAGRSTPKVQVRLGYWLILLSAVSNLAYTLAVTQISVPWALIPIFLAGTGMGLIFPILALSVIDLALSSAGWRLRCRCSCS